jgi:hypothetical protein
LRELEWAMRVYPEDINDAVNQLAGLARSRPDQFTPLLELATAALRK